MKKIFLILALYGFSTLNAQNPQQIQVYYDDMYGANPGYNHNNNPNNNNNGYYSNTPPPQYPQGYNSRPQINVQVNPFYNPIPGFCAPVVINRYPYPNMYSYLPPMMIGHRRHHYGRKFHNRY